MVDRNTLLKLLEIKKTDLFHGFHTNSQYCLNQETKLELGEMVAMAYKWYRNMFRLYHDTQYIFLNILKSPKTTKILNY